MTDPSKTTDFLNFGENIRSAFPNITLSMHRFRNQETFIIDVTDVYSVLKFLKNDVNFKMDLLIDVTAADYLNYPVEQPGRFAVIWILSSTEYDHRISIKSYLNPSIDTEGIVSDPALVAPSVCDLWAGAEWREREQFDMFGIKFEGHPDLRRILLWKDYPGHPLRKDYPLHGYREREQYRVLERSDSD